MNVHFIIGHAARAILIGTAAASAGCYSREVVYERPAPVYVAPPGEVYIAEPAPVPAPVAEVVAVCPGPEYIWVGGYYEWYGPAPGRYVWVRGHWDRPAHARAVWVQPGWKHGRGGYSWERGHWR